jgi:hypothetical protein
MCSNVYLSFLRLLVSPSVMLMTELSARLTLADDTAVVGVLDSTWLVEILGMWYLVVGILPRIESATARKN